LAAASLDSIGGTAFAVGAGAGSGAAMGAIGSGFCAAAGGAADATGASPRARSKTMRGGLERIISVT